MARLETKVAVRRHSPASGFGELNRKQQVKNEVKRVRWIKGSFVSFY